MHQTIRNDKGEPIFAIVPWAEYVALRDFAADARKSDEQLYDEARARNETALPERVWLEIEAGAHPIKAIRKWRGLNQEDLARTAGTSKAYISQIETRHRRPGRELSLAIAAALDVNLGALTDEEIPAE